MLTHPWHVRLLRGFTAQQGPKVIRRFRTQKTGALLAYLAFFIGRSHGREELVDLFWPDSDRESGRASLRTALASLRRQLEPPGTPANSVLLADRAHVWLNPQAIHTDVAEFESALQNSFSPVSLEGRLQAQCHAIELYKGELLPGYYEEWIFAERERLSAAFLELAEETVRICEQMGDLERGLDYARRWAAADRFDEKAHGAIMRLYLAMDRPTDALRQFEELDRLLQLELNVSPSASLCALAERGRLSLTSNAGKHKPPNAVSAPRIRRLSVRRRPQPLSSIFPKARLDLPLPLTRFFGRHTEIMALQQILETGCSMSDPTRRSRSGARLVTLTGSGGTGKTRTAIEVSAGLTARFTGGVIFVPLADTADPRLIVKAITEALRLPPVSSQEPLEQLVEALSGNPVLVVLDNFEQLLSPLSAAGEGASPEAGPEAVHTMLVRMPNLSFLVTSRQRLDVEGEQEYALHPLPTPNRPGSAERLLEFASVQLFVDRAQAMRADFQLTERNVETIGKLCEKLEGIPLAIELAAGWTGVLSPTQILERLSHRFELLVSKRKGVAARHQTLHAALDWNYKLFSPDLQRFFARLSVFRAGWTLEAAQAVCDAPNALEILDVLHHRSLVVTEETSDGEATRMRYRLLETLREFGWEQLTASDRTDVLRRHALYYAGLAETIYPLLTGEAQAVFQDRLASELENFRLILNSRTPTREEALAQLSLGGFLWSFWTNRGDIAEGRRCLDRALLDDTTKEPTEARSIALRGAGLLAWYQHDWQPARQYLQEGLDICRMRGDARGIANMLSNLGIVAAAQDDQRTAHSYYTESLQHHRTSQNKVGIASTVANLGNLAAAQGDYKQASALFVEALAINRELKNKSGIIYILQLIGMGYVRDGRPWLARACFEESLMLQRDLRDRRGIAQFLHELASLLGPTPHAARLWSAAQALNASVSGAPLPPATGEDAARQELGDTLYTKLREEGRVLTLQQAIQEALEAAAEKFS